MNKFEKKEILQAYSPEIWWCDDCSNEFHPMIKTQPISLRISVGILTIGSLGFAYYFPNTKPWIWFKIPGILLLIIAPLTNILILNNLSKKREVAKGFNKLKYGMIIPQCLLCGSTKVKIKHESNQKSNYKL